MFLKQVLSSLLIAIVSCLSAQDIQSTFDLAEFQFETGDVAYAKSLYKRVQFFDTDYNFISSFDRLSDIYLKEGDSTAAIDELLKYRDFLEFGSDNWLKNNFKLIGLQLSIDKPKEALAELLQMKYMSLDSLNKKKMKLYLAVAHFQDKDFKKSEQVFKEVVPESEHELLTSIFKKNNRLEKRYNLVRLQLMSSVLPGSGQIYAGFYKEGVNSLVLVGGFIYLFVHINKTYGLVSALLGVYPWVSRYQIGGINKAKSLAQLRIKLKREVYYHEVLDLVK
jgi:tetratricopeptide (TPR) repeat protein